MASAVVQQLSADSPPLFAQTSVLLAAGHLLQKKKVKVVKTANRFTVNQSKMNKTGNALMVWTALAWLKLDRHAKYLS